MHVRDHSVAISGVGPESSRFTKAQRSLGGHIAVPCVPHRASEVANEAYRDKREVCPSTHATEVPANLVRWHWPWLRRLAADCATSATSRVGRNFISQRE